MTGNGQMTAESITVLKKVWWVKTKTHFRKHIVPVITHSYTCFTHVFISNYVLHSTGSMYDRQFGELIRERVCVSQLPAEVVQTAG